ncbi:polyphosphate kinase 1 [Dyadobacter chenwenxiniae]|uniref:Polyphosphate kinase n=1 Tax=Dyadobacter chenwenxiniae TaxID=2906456 RepID=A0A9X1PNE9_9BACT|nr:polyphosphate kinase 1 [Dyadobacter chenwenxiniae]MCF0063620.1 polyphosphate kinase 1 [Dyadobacter chenwenxiniae]UON83296.1 polyphosphate kinase 1 [Dyadobacter chenwenxiniae]
MEEYRYFNRDISWLSFNGRVLEEAANNAVPLMERIRFLSIYSSNLDEFYRVRMPYLQKKEIQDGGEDAYSKAGAIIDKQQDEFGRILRDSIIPSLSNLGVHFCYKNGIPEDIASIANDYFFAQVAGFLQPVIIKKNTSFFPENNQLYLVVILEFSSGKERVALVNIPVGNLSRFLKVTSGKKDYIVFLEDIIKRNLKSLFPAAVGIQAFNIKVTRDAELDMMDEDGDDIAEKFEKQLTKRDFGFATRLLFEPGLPLRHLQHIVSFFDLKSASVVQGGRYHNLKDLASLPVTPPADTYPKWPAVEGIEGVDENHTLFDSLTVRDLMVHAPYQSYDTILRFFNEAAINPLVEEIYTTMYRVAHDSKIAFALISAAKNGKKVTVLVELKARFDEANNIRWAKKMKSAGVKIVHSVNALKVHAKLALVKRRHAEHPYLGLFATGNLNEGTARFYTDHILLTAHQPMLMEAETLFRFLSKKKKPDSSDIIAFKHLLVAQFNLQAKFLQLIDREIEHARNGRTAGITIKLNNLEEEVLVNKLYEASQAGIPVRLIVRSVCRIVPGLQGQSENIVVKRIVDRFLEHGRVFIFHNNGNPEIFMGSADWMNRNIYRRIEVCFPVYSEKLKAELTEMIELQWQDTEQAVMIDSELNNVSLKGTGSGIRSQEAIYRLLSGGVAELKLI